MAIFQWSNLKMLHLSYSNVVDVEYLCMQIFYGSEFLVR